MIFCSSELFYKPFSILFRLYVRINSYLLILDKSVDFKDRERYKPKIVIDCAAPSLVEDLTNLRRKFHVVSRI